MKARKEPKKVKTLTIIISLAMFLSGCSTQKEIQKNHSTGLYFSQFLLPTRCISQHRSHYDKGVML